MKTPDWERIQEIYDQARNLPLSKRRAFVEQVCGINTAMAREVVDLLEFDDESFPSPPVDLPLAPSADDLLGRTIGERYFIEKELGGGGMGRVYLARDANVNGKAVVIKVLSLELREHSYARQKFDQEVEALVRIRHKGVVDVFDRGKLDDGRPYFVMEFVEGELLRSQIPSGGMNFEHAATILRQIGEALEQAHQQGVFHRDLKPENVLLRRGTNDVVLIDFGIAKVTDSVVASTTTNGQSAGTMLYMSPEQLRGEKVSAASDIYSMAVLAYEMLTGQLPFNTSSPARLSELQKKPLRVKPRRVREDLSRTAEAIMLRALSFDPSARYEHANKFGESLAKALSVSPVVPRERWLKPIRTSLLVLVSMGLISFGIYKLITWKPPEPNRSFDYFLTVQPMYDGQPFKAPFRSHGEEPYKNGDKFRLTVSTRVPAYLYIFREGPPTANDTNFRMIYPRQATNNGSASLGAEQSVESDWITFSDAAGAENFWFVWSTSPVSELSSATSEAFKHPDGGLTGPTLEVVKQYLMAKKAEINATTFNYNSNQTAVVRARRDLLVTLAQFKHR
jgi:serine/threonine protein kinase